MLVASCGARTGLRGTLGDAGPAPATACDRGDGGRDSGCIPATCTQGVCVTSIFFNEISDVATDGTSVYWTTPNVVMKTSTCGADLLQIATCGVKPEAIAVHDTSIFFTTMGTLQKVAKEGGTPSVLATFDDDEVMGLEVSAGVVYWTSRSTATHAGSLRSVPTTGGSPTTLFTGPIDPGLAVDASFVYWGSARAIMKEHLDGSGLETLVENQALASITVDATSVYWTDGCGRLSKIGKPGGIGDFVVIGGAMCIDAKGHLVAVDGAHVYWWLVGASSGTLFRADLDGTNKAQLVVDGVTPTALALDSSNVYLADREKIESLAK